MTLETKFRNYIRNLLRKNGVSSYIIEHRSGGTVGFPDTLVLLGGLLLPVELKLGTRDRRTSKMHISELRPAQIRWLEEHRRAGGDACMLIGVPEKSTWVVFMRRDVSRNSLQAWRAGFDMETLIPVARGDKLLVAPVTW
jgi:hypothetical protein